MFKIETYIKKILSSKIYDIVKVTPLEHAEKLSKELNNDIFFKREDLQTIHSFKIRGAHNKLTLLTEAQKKVGVIAASAGNHAQGVAMSAKHLGISATIVMGKNTPPIKIEGVKKYGASIILHGDTYNEASEYAMQIAKNENKTFIPPYDDPDIIAGQGTIAQEILNQIHFDDLDMIFIPVGGGGLLAGICCYLAYLAPHIKIITVEAENSDCMNQSLKKQKRIRLSRDNLDLFADGISVDTPGKLTYEIAKRYVSDTVVVSPDEICSAIKDLYDETRVLTEPAGAAAVAGMKQYLKKKQFSNKKCICLVTGSNINFFRLSHISERASIGEKKEGIFIIQLPEKNGSLKSFCKKLGKRSITALNYRKTNNDIAFVYCGIELKKTNEQNALQELFQETNYTITDISTNEMAKTHIQHLIGGPTSSTNNNALEFIFRFEFPEREGALIRFLNSIGNKFPISLFHYRFQGGAWGKVLIGFLGSKKDKIKIEESLKTIGYRYWDETNNIAYQTFLK